MSTRLFNAPVYYALAQVQFNPIPAIEKYVAEIQDRLRREGYPQFAPQIPMWRILDNDHRSGFVLTQETIVFHTTRYETHREFLKQLLRGLEVVHQVVGLDHVSRLGLRYLDAVLPEEDEQVEPYLQPGLRGIRTDARHLLTVSESSFATDLQPSGCTGTLVTRVYWAHDRLGYPRDLNESGLEMDARFADHPPCTHAVMDADHYMMHHIPFDLERIRDLLLALHAPIRQIFDAMTTDYARARWA